jgi:hypothetical protein
MQHAITAVADLLTRPENADKSAEELAKEVVDGLNRFYRSQTTDTPPALIPGRAYLFPWAPVALWVSFRSPDGLLWMTSRDSDYGLLIPEDRQALQYRTAGSTRLSVGGPADNKDGWTVRRWVHLKGARAFRYRIAATTEGSVLLEGPQKGGFQAEPNAMMKRFFTH